MVLHLVSRPAHTRGAGIRHQKPEGYGKVSGIVLNKFNICLLSGRLKTITNWAMGSVQEVSGMSIGYFGAS